MDSQQRYSCHAYHSVYIHTLVLWLTVMLIVYLEPFHTRQHTLLSQWHDYVSYWPRSYAYTELHNTATAIATDYWLLFNNIMYADMWLIRYPEQSRVIRTLFDS